MTVALLTSWGGQPAGTLYNSDSTTEAAMVVAKVATSNLAGAVTWVKPGSDPGVNGPGLSAAQAAAVARIDTIGNPAAGAMIVGGGLCIAANSSPLNCTVTDVTRVTPSGKKINGVRMTANAGTNCTIEFAIRPSTLASGRLTTLAYVDASVTGLAPQVTTYVADSAYTNFFTSVFLRDEVGWWHTGPGSPSATASKWSVGAGAPTFGTTSFSKVKFRLDYTAGQTPWVEIFGMWEAADAPKSWLSFTADDGYSSQYSIMAPMLEKYGFTGSFSIIADLIGTGGYMSLANLQDLVARGHECVVHGPIGGAGSLLNYTGSADRYAAVYNDLKFHQDYLKNNGLAKLGSENVYVFPQGQYEFSVGDPTITNALAALGFIGGRGTNSNGVDNKRCLFGSTDRLRNIVGHLWTSAPAEAANITTIVGRINNLAAEKLDGCVMNHKFQAGASADSLTIATADYETIVRAAADNVRAGTQEVVPLSQQVYRGAMVKQV
jgi:Polysaccharide deacetylase